MPPTLTPGMTLSSAPKLPSLEMDTRLGNEPASDPRAQSEVTTPEAPSRHQKSLHEFRKAFDDNMRNKPVHHDKTYVLLLSWADELDDLGVKPEVDKLQEAFQKGYGFEVTRERLESPKPLQQLRKVLSEFIFKYDGEDTLLIIYYAGHGRYDGRPTRENGMHFEAKGSPPSKTERDRNSIAWSGAEHNITQTTGDVLVIFDCCNAGGFGGQKVRTLTMPNFEFIAACGVEEVAAVPGESSFTHALMWALNELKVRDEYPFMSSTLVEKIKQCPQLNKGQKPELRRRDGTVWLAPLNIDKLGTQKQPHSERRKAHHQFIDLRLHFYRNVEPDDARNVALQLSSLVNDKDSFAKHIELLDVSDSISKYVAKWRATANGKRKRAASAFSADTPISPASEVNLSTQEVEMATMPLVGRPRLNELAQLTQLVQPPGALYHLRMFFDCSLRWMATRVRPRSDGSIQVPGSRRAINEESGEDSRS